MLVTPPVICQVGEDDEGLYLCEAENGVSDPLGKLVGLKINSKLNSFASQIKSQNPKLIRFIFALLYIDIETV